MRRRSVLNGKLSLIHRIFQAQIWKKGTLLGLENEHCIKMISVDASLNGLVSDIVTGGLNSTIMDISHAFYHFKLVYIVQILTKLQENVAIVSCVNLNFTYCVSTCVSLDKKSGAMGFL